jgi:hypothetical protein
MSDAVKGEFLSPQHFAKHPVWRYLNDDSQDDTLMRPVEPLPTDTLDGCVVGCKVKFADGGSVWAGLSNIDVSSKMSTEQFLVACFFLGEERIWLARYHDVDYRRNGPEHLAQSFGKNIEDVFPVSYDLTPYVIGDESVLKGVIEQVPRYKLSDAQLSELMHCGKLD